jgi:hypothetical protein
MITEHMIKDEIGRLESWIGKKMDSRFTEAWLDRCEDMDVTPFLKAMQSFKGADWFPNLRDFCSEYNRGLGGGGDEWTRSCDWCDQGILIYLKEVGGRKYEYEGKCGNCHPTGKRFENLLLIYPSKPQVRLHGLHLAKKEACETARANGQDPYAPVHEVFSNPLKGRNDPAKERERQASLNQDRKRENKEVPF